MLVEWIDSSELPPPTATFLDVILYSRQQLDLERAATNGQGQTAAPLIDPARGDWGIISVKGQLCDYELPMQPITAMRNALGKEEGGSGVPLDREEYLKSVAFWSMHVSAK